MSIFDQAQESQAQTQEYRFASGDINEYLSEMSVDKQDMGLSADVDNDDDPLFEDDPKDQELQMPGRVANVSGKLVASVIDSVIPETLAFISQGKSDEYKADASQRQELEKALSKYLSIKGLDLPPGVLLLVLLVSIYGTKVPHALQSRKLNQRQQALDDRERELNAREASLNP